MVSTPSTGTKPNRLIREKSPYLLQHAYNPVDWYPWGDEAFDRAKLEDKPVFLSIGYSSCHWCHVMEQESFSDLRVARLLNDAFVCIKVDREERPDIDSMYMAASQLLTGSGGWPLSIIMTADKVPFFADSYLPKESRFGRSGLLDLIPRVSDMWKNNRTEIDASARQVMERLQKPAYVTVKGKVDKALLESGYRSLQGTYDRQNGGFGEAPKFPAAHRLSFLLRYRKRDQSGEALAMVQATLDAMHAGGIYDHVGFGFHRYSTDSEWLVPHFEKMLYDQALIALACIETFQETKIPRYRRIAEEILAYVRRDMVSPSGGFYSSEDADSEGAEGKFYLWTDNELRSALTPAETVLATRVYHVTPAGNYLNPETGKPSGSNILHTDRDQAAIAGELGLTEGELYQRLGTIRSKLFAVRAKRPRPAKDDKLLTDWNALMIVAFARAAQVFGKAEYAQTAKAAADFISRGMDEHRCILYHRFRDDWAIPGFVDDYAFFVWALLELYETAFEIKYLSLAVELTGYMLNHFWDEEEGGFYFTSDAGENMPVRRKEFFDTAYPSGNSVALSNLLRLARITGNSDYEERAERIAAASLAMLVKYPSAFTQQLQALDFALGPSLEIVISGLQGAADTRRMLKVVRDRFIPNKVLLLRPPAEEVAGITAISPFTEPLLMLEGKATAYVCEDYRCELPTTDTVELERLIGHKDIS
jgi:uncharacterized protein YyaL (SSP411 family)